MLQKIPCKVNFPGNKAEQDSELWPGRRNVKSCLPVTRLTNRLMGQNLKC